MSNYKIRNCICSKHRAIRQLEPIRALNVKVYTFKNASIIINIFTDS